MKDVKRIKFDDIKPFINDAKKERVAFSDNKNNEWYGIFEGSEIVSFFCFYHTKKTARFKSNYTVPKARCKGYLQQFIEFAIMKCIYLGITEMTAFCTEKSIKSHLRHGAIAKNRRNGIIFVRYNLKR